MKKIISNTSQNAGLFKTYMNIGLDSSGAPLVVEKEIQGVKRKYLTGVASNSQVDKEDDVMTVEFLNKMKTQMLGLTVFAEHDHTIDKTLGTIVDVGGDDNNVVIEVELEPEEDNSIVEKILKKFKNGIKLGFSIYGKITKAIKETNKETKQTIRKIIDGAIFEVSVTPFPAGNGTWAESFSKSMNDMFKELKEDSEVEISDQDIKKALDEIVKRGEIQRQIYDLMWAYKSAIDQVVRGEFTGTDKKKRIEKISKEFGDKIESLSNTLSQLEAKIYEEIGKQKQLINGDIKMSKELKEKLEKDLNTALEEIQTAALEEIQKVEKSAGEEAEETVEKSTDEETEETVEKSTDEEIGEETEETVEKSTDEETEENNDSKGEEQTTEKLSETVKKLVETVAELSKKLDEKSNNESSVNKDEVVNKIKDLIKSSGLDLDNTDISFVVKEKKKSDVSESKDDERFNKSENNVDWDNNDDLERLMKDMDDSERQAVLDKYLSKNLLSD